MASICALCGTKLSFFGSHPMICANQDEVFCTSCEGRLYPMDSVERGRYVLEHGKPEHPEQMRQFLAAHEERLAMIAAHKPPTRPCPACGGDMALKHENFRIGADGRGGLDSLLLENYKVDLFACPECGKVELYTSGFAEWKAQQQAEKRAAEEAAANTPEPPPPPRPRRSGEKPPWEK